MIKTVNNQQYRHKLIFGSEKIDCLIQFDYLERLKIIVYPDQTVLVKAPAGKTLDQVLEKVQKRAAWILKQLIYFEQFKPRLPERCYVSGESCYYLGRQYRLKIIENETEAVKLVGRYLCICTPDKNDTKRVKSLYRQWYRQHASIVFNKRLDICYESIQRYGIKRPACKIRTMQKRWGSCNGMDSILLNTQLVRAPIRCIDYVITHELCHLKHPTHSDAFYRLLSRIMPDWKERKERLEHVMP